MMVDAAGEKLKSACPRASHNDASGRGHASGVFRRASHTRLCGAARSSLMASLLTAELRELTEQPVERRPDFNLTLIYPNGAYVLYLYVSYNLDDSSRSLKSHTRFRRTQAPIKVGRLKCSQSIRHDQYPHVSHHMMPPSTIDYVERVL